MDRRFRRRVQSLFDTAELRCDFVTVAEQLFENAARTAAHAFECLDSRLVRAFFVVELRDAIRRIVDFFARGYDAALERSERAFRACVCNAQLRFFIAYFFP